MTFLPFLLNRSKLPICSYNLFLFWPVTLKSVKKKYKCMYIDKQNQFKKKKKKIFFNNFVEKQQLKQKKRLKKKKKKYLCIYFGEKNQLKKKKSTIFFYFGLKPFTHLMAISNL